MVQTACLKDTILFAYGLHRGWNWEMHRAFRRSDSRSLSSPHSSAVCLQGQSWSSVPKSLNTKLMTSEPLLRRAEPFRSGECCHHCLWESLRRHVPYTVQQLKASHWVEENMFHQRNAFDYPRWSRIGSFQKISIENFHWVLYENKTFEKNARVRVLCKKQENKKK